MILPDYSGGSLLNLVAEIEHRLTGRAPSPGLHANLAGSIPAGRTYVLVLFDGLGSHQLDHPAAAALLQARRADLDAPFPTTTTVSLATAATGLPPSQHGLLGYQLWMPEVDAVANTIKWTTLWGDSLDFDTGRLLPWPNLWERLEDAGLEAFTVQPANFEGSPLTRALYRGCRFSPITSTGEIVERTLELAGRSGRLVFAYVPHVDFAAHVFGQEDEAYADAVTVAAAIWEGLRLGLPEGAVLVGTADHGHVDFSVDRQVRIPKADEEGRTFYGDGRAMFVRGDGASLATGLPARWVEFEEMMTWWGPGPRHPSFDERAPDGVLVADDGWLLLHRFSDDRLIGNHGGLTDAERLVPLLVG